MWCIFIGLGELVWGQVSTAGGQREGPLGRDAPERALAGGRKAVRDRLALHPYTAK